MGTNARLDLIASAVRTDARILRQLKSIAKAIGPQVPLNAPEPLAAIIMRLWLSGRAR